VSQGNKSGLSAALAETGAGTPPAAGGEQLALLPEPVLPEVPRTLAPAGGRPRGSRNRRTQEWVDYLLGQGRSPLEFLHSLYQRPAKQLAQELGLYMYHEGELITHCGEPVLAVGEAFRRQVEAAVAIAPYLHQKLPLALDVKGKTAGVIVVGELPAEGTAEHQALNLFMAGESEENQALTALPAEGSDSAEVGNQGK
jgi:hypothetical protein